MVHMVDVVVSDPRQAANLVVEIDFAIEVEMVSLGAIRMMSRTWACPYDNGVSRV